MVGAVTVDGLTQPFGPHPEVIFAWPTAIVTGDYRIRYSVGTGGDNDTEEKEESRIKGGVGQGSNWAALFLFVIVVMTIGGNVLVCLAVAFKRKLQNMFNYFLVSLAFSDMMSATLVMPVSIIKAAVDEMPLPKLMCVGWYSLDVLFTSSTICHLCMISIDRYMSLTYPLRYGRAKKKKHTVFKIATVWVISLCIAGPLFILSMLDSHEDTVLYKGCGPETPAFVISATVISFYLPLLIMTVMYALTVRALQQQLREQRRMTVTKSYRSASTVGGVSDPAGGSGSRRGSVFSQTTVLLGSGSDDVASTRNNYSSMISRSPLVSAKRRSLQPLPSTGGSNSVIGGLGTTHSYSVKRAGGCGSGGVGGGGVGNVGLLSSPRRSPGRGLSVADSPGPYGGRYLMVSDGSPSHGHSECGGTCSGQVVSLGVCNAPGCKDSAGCSSAGDCKLPGDADSVLSGVCGEYPSVGNSMSPHHSSSAKDSPDRRRRFNRSFTFRRSVSSNESSRRGGSGSSSPDKGRRAVQVLGILFAVFVTCYLPFFAVYVVGGTCGVPCADYISPQLLTGLEWLAYSGSMLNPIIYHIFNPDFRRAFQNLLHSDCRARRHHGTVGGGGSRLTISANTAGRHRSIELPVCRIDTV